MPKVDSLLNLLERILPLPTAPFHEGFVSAFIYGECKSLGLDPKLDPYGNILVRYGEDHGTRTVWVAHMDHPGFEIVDVEKDQVQAQWYGGVDPRYFAGARVVVYEKNSGRIRTKGRIEGIDLNTQGRVDKMAVKADRAVEVGDFGSWDLVPYRRNGQWITTKGADDLVGCAMMLAALTEAKERKLESGVLCIFSRAEEVGFIGTLGVIGANAVAISTPVISIETSKALPGIRLGGGPVIRLGDRTSVFHHQTILFMDYAAREIQNQDEEFSFQRRVMDGGTCEATPFQLNGFSAGGIAIPLRNYHNQGRNRIMPEGIHLGDAAGGVALLLEMLTRMGKWQAPIEELRRKWENGWCQYSQRLGNTEQA